MLFYIYKLTCIENGKGYIGVSCNPKRRLLEHRCRAKTGSMLPIHCAIRKYGEELFNLDVLYSSEDRKHVFGVMEPQFIKEEHTLVSEHGYNLTKGGEGVNRNTFILPPRTKEFRERMRQVHLGRPKSESHKQHMRDAKTTPAYKELARSILLGNQRSVGYHQTNAAKEAIRKSRIGKHPTDETRLKMSIAAKKRCATKKLAAGGCFNTV